MSESLLTEDEAASALVAYVFSGAIGPSDDKGVCYALVDTTPYSFSWSAALEDIDGPDAPVDRYLINIDRRTKEISTPEPIVLSEKELVDAVLAATGQHLSSWIRFTDGVLSISYKVIVKEDSDIAYVVQMRHHGSVASMDSFMALISRTIDPSALPVPTVYPIPGEMIHQSTTGMGRQITRYKPGRMASSIYAQSSHEEKLIFVRKMAFAFSACWEFQLPEPRLIGELSASKVDDQITLEIGPDRHYSLGGPFHSVRDYLRAYIKSSLIALEKQQGIEEYEEKYLHLIREFLASAPYASLYRTLEMLFCENAPNGFGPEYERANELCEAFWNNIPNWKRWNESEATQTFIEWFKFGLFMKAEWRPKDLSDEKRDSYWAENIRVVEGMFDKYSPKLNEASKT